MRTPLEFTSEETTPIKEHCKGRVYKCKQNWYLDGRGNFIEKTIMVLQKRLSCRGCAKCGWQEDDLHEQIACQNPPIINSPEHDALYRLAMTNVGTDWETGYVDSYDLEFIPLPKDAK